GRLRGRTAPIFARALAAWGHQARLFLPGEDGEDFGRPHAVRLSDCPGGTQTETGCRAEPDREDPRRGRGRRAKPGTRGQTRRGPREALMAQSSRPTRKLLAISGHPIRGASSSNPQAFEVRSPPRMVRRRFLAQQVRSVTPIVLLVFFGSFVMHSSGVQPIDALLIIGGSVPLWLVVGFLGALRIGRECDSSGVYRPNI